MSGHLTDDGEFQSDKYPWCKPGFVALKITDEMAQPFLWAYADARWLIDGQFSADLRQALLNAGFEAD